jgi:hypothetical protein
MGFRPLNRRNRFYVEDGHLVREVAEAEGFPGYIHRCTKQVLETVAHVISETPTEGEGTTMMQIADDEKLAYSQVNVALEFLKDRGIVEVRHRRCYPGTADPHLDALTEFHALAAEPKPT